MALNNRKKFELQKKASGTGRANGSQLQEEDSEAQSPPPTLRDSEDLPSSSREPRSPCPEDEPSPQKPHESFRLTSCSFVIQKYIERPMLISNRKFDVRVWVLLRQDMSLYFFK